MRNRTAVTTSRCSRIACSGVLPGGTRKPQYSATPKSGRNFAAVAWRRRSPGSPSSGSTMPRKILASPVRRPVSGRKKLSSSLRR